MGHCILFRCAFFYGALHKSQPNSTCRGLPLPNTCVTVSPERRRTRILVTSGRVTSGGCAAGAAAEVAEQAPSASAMSIALTSGWGCSTAQAFGGAGLQAPSTSATSFALFKLENRWQ